MGGERGIGVKSAGAVRACRAAAEHSIVQRDANESARRQWATERRFVACPCMALTWESQNGKSCAESTWASM